MQRYLEPLLAANVVWRFEKSADTLQPAHVQPMAESLISHFGRLVRIGISITTFLKGPLGAFPSTRHPTSINQLHLLKTGNPHQDNIECPLSEPLPSGRLLGSGLFNPLSLLLFSQHHRLPVVVIRLMLELAQLIFRTILIISPSLHITPPELSNTL